MNNNTLLCNVFYYSKFPVKRTDGLSADDLIRAVKNIHRIWTIGCRTKFVSDEFKQFY